MRGFSLLELLVVMGIFSILAGVGLPWSINSYTRALNGNDIALIRSALSRARGESLARVCEAARCSKGADQGVSIEEHTLTIFEGDSYATREPTEDEVIPLDGILDSEGVKEFVFRGDTADVTASGTLTIQQENGITHTISVNEESGIIEQ